MCVCVCACYTQLEGTEDQSNVDGATFQVITKHTLYTLRAQLTASSRSSRAFTAAMPPSSPPVAKVDARFVGLSPPPSLDSPAPVSAGAKRCQMLSMDALETAAVPKTLLDECAQTSAIDLQ